MVLDVRDLYPNALLENPSVLDFRDWYPNALFQVPEVLEFRDSVPKLVLVCALIVNAIVNAKSVSDAYIVAHKTEMRVSDLVSMGYDFERISELSGLSSDSTYTDTEQFERQGYEQEGDVH